MISLSTKYSFRVPIYAECVSPDVFLGKSLEEISMLEVLEGNKKRALKDLFNIKVEDEISNQTIAIKIQGDVSKVRMIGAKMTTGKIIIVGGVGMHLGEMMRGGEIQVEGSVDSWVGSMMEDGTIEIVGSAADYVGAPQRGSYKGMRGGKIIIHGDAGNDLGCSIRGGIIEVKGNAGEFVGIHMRDGAILIRGDCASRAGAGMLNGKIILCGHVPSILPTFTLDSLKASTDIEKEKITGPFYRFIGDTADNGEGKLFVSKPRNPHLSSCEKYLE